MFWFANSVVYVHLYDGVSFVSFLYTNHVDVDDGKRPWR